MISVSLLKNSDLEEAVLPYRDQDLLNRTLVGFDVREGRDRLFVLGLVPPVAISPLVYVWLVMHQRPTLGQLRQFKRYVDTVEGFDYQTFLAEVCNEPSARFAAFMGFSPGPVIGKRQIYERRL